MFAKKLYLVKKTGEITVYEGELDNPRKNCLLLSYIITQAMSDGMTAVRIGVDQTSFEPYLKYYGPIGYENPRWWDMTPPPRHQFPYILQYLISITSVECGMPIKGKIQVVNKSKILAPEHRKLAIDIYIPDMYTIELKWPDCFAMKHDYSQVPQDNNA